VRARARVSDRAFFAGAFITIPRTFPPAGIMRSSAAAALQLLPCAFTMACVHVQHQKRTLRALLTAALVRAQLCQRMCARCALECGTQRPCVRQPARLSMLM
jgi:hypothetical protein